MLSDSDCNNTYPITKMPFETMRRAFNHCVYNSSQRGSIDWNTVDVLDYIGIGEASTRERGFAIQQSKRDSTKLEAKVTT